MWMEPQERAFSQIEDILSKEPVLTYYDVKKLVTVSCDASKSGLGAVFQDDKPIAFASRSMTDAEVRYAQIEKELLAVVFAMERFHQFTYGQSVTVESDYRPLEMIMKKNLSAAPPRLQRMLLRLQQCNFSLKYKPGKELVIADTLSRAYTSDSDSTMEEDVRQHVLTVVENIPVEASRLQSIKTTTARDEDLCQLQNIILNGWPDNKSNVPLELHEYWSCRDELSVADGLILRGDRIVIPRELCSTMLRLLHVGHFGVEKTTRKARGAVYWPSIDSQIKDMILKCDTCLTHRSANRGNHWYSMKFHMALGKK